MSAKRSEKRETTTMKMRGPKKARVAMGGLRSHAAFAQNMMNHICRRGTSPRIDLTTATKCIFNVIVFAVMLVRAPPGNA